MKVIQCAFRCFKARNEYCDLLGTGEELGRSRSNDTGNGEDSQKVPARLLSPSTDMSKQIKRALTCDQTGQATNAAAPVASLGNSKRCSRPQIKRKVAKRLKFKPKLFGISENSQEDPECMGGVSLGASPGPTSMTSLRPYPGNRSGRQSSDLSNEERSMAAMRSSEICNQQPERFAPHDLPTLDSGEFMMRRAVNGCPSPPRRPATPITPRADSPGPAARHSGDAECHASVRRYGASVASDTGHLNVSESFRNSSSSESGDLDQVHHQSIHRQTTSEASVSQVSAPRTRVRYQWHVSSGSSFYAHHYRDNVKAHIDSRASFRNSSRFEPGDRVQAHQSMKRQNASEASVSASRTRVRRQGETSNQRTHVSSGSEDAYSVGASFRNNDTYVRVCLAVKLCYSFSFSVLLCLFFFYTYN